MAIRSKTDQFKILRDEIREVASGVRYIRASVDLLDDEIKILRTDIKDQDQKFFDWKSDIYNKIDEFIKPVRDLQEEDASMDIRLTRLEKKNPLN